MGISDIESDTLSKNPKVAELPEILRSGVNELGYKVIYDEEKDPNVVSSQATRDFFMLGETKDKNGGSSGSQPSMPETGSSERANTSSTSKKTKEDVRKKLQSKD